MLLILTDQPRANRSKFWLKLYVDEKFVVEKRRLVCNLSKQIKNVSICTQEEESVHYRIRTHGEESIVLAQSRKRGDIMEDLKALSESTNFLPDSTKWTMILEKAMYKRLGISTKEERPLIEYQKKVDKKPTPSPSPSPSPLPLPPIDNSSNSLFGTIISLLMSLTVTVLHLSTVIIKKVLRFKEEPPPEVVLSPTRKRKVTDTEINIKEFSIDLVKPLIYLGPSLYYRLCLSLGRAAATLAKQDASHLLLKELPMKKHINWNDGISKASADWTHTNGHNATLELSMSFPDMMTFHSFTEWFFAFIGELKGPEEVILDILRKQYPRLWSVISRIALIEDIILWGQDTGIPDLLSIDMELDFNIQQMQQYYPSLPKMLKVTEQITVTTLDPTGQYMLSKMVFNCKQSKFYVQAMKYCSSLVWLDPKTLKPIPDGKGFYKTFRNNSNVKIVVQASAAVFGPIVMPIPITELNINAYDDSLKKSNSNESPSALHGVVTVDYARKMGYESALCITGDRFTWSPGAATSIVRALSLNSFFDSVLKSLCIHVCSHQGILYIGSTVSLPCGGMIGRALQTIAKFLLHDKVIEHFAQLSSDCFLAISEDVAYHLPVLMQAVETTSSSSD
eukprot:NODE_1280_length_2033_cov_22.888482_g1085_i0.p1 GENE.NODE_1280_length_2033_cov_22.888482_g1085_i0~~NODE_1280_length_2033_cov_22.888482_g1085_i0.p1  ORF type:complete len:621 (+),score=100.54 NODE_1280_length_2033_cov_22.888482_g1085_i0:35-1897(+)